MYVPIGGIEQWIEICGEGAGKPVLLFLHGGPGGPSWPAACAWRPWEQHFTVVHWDQRGAGRTFARNGPEGCGPLTVGRMVEDGLEAAAFLQQELRAEKLLLVGHSWGSVLGLHMVKQRPDLFCAYVGASQAVNLTKGEAIAYARLLALAKDANNGEAQRALETLGPPPYADRPKFLEFRRCMDQLAVSGVDSPQPRPEPPNPAFDQEAREMVARGAEFSRAQLFSAYKSIDLETLGLEFDIPVFFFMGSADLATPIELAEDYLAKIKAPATGLVRFEGCHHFFVMNQPDRFLRELLDQVGPVLRR